MSSPLKQNTTTIQNLLNKINELPEASGGVELPELTNEGSASDLLSGKQLIDGDGNVVNGTIPTKTASDLTTSGATITVPSGYYASNATKTIASGSAKTPATTVTKNPSISVNSSGLITASVSGTQSVTPTVTAGYVSSGTAGTITVSGSATKQLATQAAKTITPSTSSQTAVASGRYTTGAVTVAAIPDTYIQPSGTLDVTANGTHDVKNYASVNVNVPSSGGGASVDTCTVTFMPPKQGSTHMNTTYMVYENNEFKWKTYNKNIFSAESEPIIIYPVKYSLIQYWYQYSMLAASGACEYISKFRSGDTGGYVVWVFGDTTIEITNPCFVYDTQITLINGLQKAVQYITYDDELLVWDFDNGCYASAKPLWIKKQQINSYYYHCEFENGITLNLVGSDGKCHRVFCIDEGRFESATDCVGKMVMTQLGATKLVSCEKVEETVEYYNIITKYHLNLFANSILTSCRLNNLYPIEDMKFVKDNQNYIPYEAYSNITKDFYEGLRLSERNSDDICWINDYVGNLYALMESVDN